MDLSLVIGIAGMLLVLFAFLMVQRHRWSQDDVLYDLFNAVGSTLLALSALVTRAWPFAILNTIWALYSLRDVLFLDRWTLIPRRKKSIVRRGG